MDFDKIRRRTWLSWATIGLLVALCAVLAGLQYRWIGEVADAESHRLREELQSRLNLLRRDLNAEISTACNAYTPSNWEVQKLGRDEAYLSQFRQRKQAGDRVVRRIAIAVPQNLELVLFFPDEAGKRLVRGEWPREWNAMHDSLIVRLRGGPAPLSQSSTLVEFPRFGTENSSSGPRSIEQDWLLLDLDADFIGQSLVPEMLNRYLGQTGKLEYDAEVISKADPTFSIYRSADADSASTWIPDASVDLVEISRTPFPVAVTNAPVGSAGQEGARNASGASAALSASGAGPGSGPGPSRGLWTLLVHRHAGSLETIVARGRLRNILLSASLLLLILATTYALVRFSRRAQRFAELQMDFVAGVSHELRTPLTVIRTAAYNLRGDLASQPAQVTRYGALIRAESEKLSALVEQVLRYGNARAGRVLQQREPVAISEVIEAGLQAARAAGQKKDVVIEKRIDADLPEVLGDRASLQHALQNLFDNAIKYGTRENDWVGVFASTSKNGGPKSVEIRVCDRGPGIPADERENIFDPFFRGRRPQDDQIHGTGLGLNLVKRIVEAHGGSVAVRSREEQGAEFVVRLPGVSRPPNEANSNPENEPHA
jgi:signal transduction histidine kinase